MNVEQFANERQTAIATLRRNGFAVEARTLREDTLNQLEAWLDPHVDVERMEQLAADRAWIPAARERTRAMLADIGDGGF